jgi:hypothetical protein|tara:strand:+ start:10527 stop:10997 length:471 start_codon:yes stop_codon:yes gene_type:complete
MNIFKLDEPIRSCAQMHCDKHVSKMILESAQMLCTALWVNGQSAPYKAVHAKHPCTLWAAESLDNWLWLKELAIYLNEEFCWRYDRNQNHKSADVVMSLPDLSVESKGLQQQPQCMPEEYKIYNDPITAYRSYYIGEKSGFAQWTKREVPEWFKTP